MPTPDTYLTLSKPGRGEYREKGSKFLGFAHQVMSEEETDQQRGLLRKEYHDATHQPFAYRLVDGTVRSSDDGEPRGTSGPSVLAQIEKCELYNVQVVVVRYFGGTKLGKGGLARAFSECARVTLEDTEFKTVENKALISIVIPPDLVKIANSIVFQYSGEINNISYGIQVDINYMIAASQLEVCRSSLIERFGSEILKSNA